MRKIFNAPLPDEPYKTTTSKGLVVECVYAGPRYILCRFENDGTFMSYDGMSEDEPEKLQAMMVEEPGSYQVVFDAETDPLIAAYLTDEYTHGDVDDYVEQLPGGGEWVFYHADKTGIINQHRFTNDLRHNKASNSFIQPRLRTHAVTADGFWESVEVTAASLRGRKDTEEFTAEEIKQIDAVLDELNGIKAKYGSVNHWKIPFPSMPNI